VPDGQSSGPVSRFFYDCEFIEDGRTIDLVSIAVIAEDGREYYAVSTEFDPGRAGAWVRTNVLDKLPPPADAAWRSRRSIRDELGEFLLAPGGEVQLWAWVAAYDHVALAQLWGDMTALPRRIPRFTMAGRRSRRTVRTATTRSRTPGWHTPDGRSPMGRCAVLPTLEG